ncbi:MAG: hypothetical protein AXA67_09245 [Methylothermaceae bacteria B42]|nr:MAG: hypothetical protein AXA67_09245 [Methylothermaceae bacteria B42]HHJ39490.1 hypothetical protein [Methylothermaceae bacterium]
MNLTNKVFLVLLILNSVVFLRELFVSSPESVRVVGDAGRPVERLVLIEELSEAPAPATAREEKKKPTKKKASASPKTVTKPRKEAQKQLKNKQSPQKKPKVILGGCYRIGPFQGLVTAHRVGEQLKSAGLNAKVKTKSVIETRGYWLMYPPKDSIESSRLALAELQDKGLRDLWLFETGPWKGAISLGVFDTRKRAEIAARRLRKKGIEVKVMPMKRYRILHWIHVDRSIPMRLEKELKQKFPGLKIISESCSYK